MSKTEDLRTLETMLGLYCRGLHGWAAGLCPGCAELLHYARGRLERCPREPKPPCRSCPTHCYAPGPRERIRAVMRYSGPRLAFRAPLAFLRHWLAGRDREAR